MADTSKNSNEDTELTMCDVLEEEQELEEDANAVLGGSDDTNCSYDQGYVSRQALYACKSCSVEGDAGVCLACCYACHDGHEVVELYTKRDFRCDCGNSKFNGKVCVLRPSKDAVNSKNKYNQNFKGLYCSCSRPYPDLEDSFPDEMIQCIMCEDWFHGRHLKVEIPEDYHEMICYKCMEAHKFLFSYLDKNVTKEAPDSKILSSEQSEMKTGNNIKSELASNGCASKEEKELIDVVNDDVNSCVVKNEQNKSNEDNKPAIKSECREFIETTKSNSPKVELNENNSASSSKVKTETMCNGSSNNNCVLKSVEITKVVSAFWPENWRRKLCHCDKCLKMYEELQCKFLLDPQDTIQAYEERGQGTKESQYDRGLSALGKLDRVRQMEAVRAYTNMKGQLKEYLKDFADNKRTVCESDIKEFFERIGKNRN